MRLAELLATDCRLVRLHPELPFSYLDGSFAGLRFDDSPGHQAEAAIHHQPQVDLKGHMAG